MKSTGKLGQIALLAALFLPCVFQAQTFNISGFVYLDSDLSQSYNPSSSQWDKGLGAIRVKLYADDNSNGSLEPTDVHLQTYTTNGDGSFSFSVTPSNLSASIQINSSEDDAEERTSTGVMDLNSTDLQLGHEGGSAQWVGMNFNAVNIPGGASITSAFIDFTIDEESKSNANLTFYGEDINNSPEFTTTSYNISNRTRTSAANEVDWNNVPSWKKNNVGEIRTTPDLSPIIQEITDRSGWLAGNNLSILIEGTDRRTAESYNGSPNDAPTLRVNYSMTAWNRFILVLESADLSPGTRYTSYDEIAVNLSGGGTTSTNNNIGLLTKSPLCFAVSDQDDALHIMNRFSGVNKEVGHLGVANVEAIALNLNGDTLFAANSDDFGWINQLTGVYSSIGAFGTGNRNSSTQVFNDVDGLAFDVQNRILWASNRSAGFDELFQVDRSTGAHINNAFGSNLDYVISSGSDLLDDLDDLAVDPLDGQIYATTNSSGGVTRFITLNSSTGAATLISTMSIDDVEGQGFHNDGQFYVVTGDGAGTGNRDRLFELDKSNGQVQVISQFDVNSDFESCDCLSGPGINLVFGTVYRDLNTDAQLNPGESGMANIKVYFYLDFDDNGVIDWQDPIIDSAVTDANGNYAFTTHLQDNFVIGSNLNDYPPYSNLTTDNLESAEFPSTGLTDPSNNFGFESTTLPIELVNFTAKQEGSAVKLDWECYTEVNNDYFLVERSGDVGNFRAIDKVNSSSSKSSFNNTYSCLDRKPLPGENYYRLKQIDNDQSYAYSSIVSVWVDRNLKSNGIKLSPNPMPNFELNIEFNDMNSVARHCDIKVYAISGQLMFQQDIQISSGSNSASLFMNNLAHGEYILEIDQKGKPTIVSRFSKL